jgi:hypothetical protein
MYEYEPLTRFDVFQVEAFALIVCTFGMFASVAAYMMAVF